MKNKYSVILIIILFFISISSPLVYSIESNINIDLLKIPKNDEFFDQKISLLMRLAGFPSLVACIIKDEKIIWSNGYGYYDRSDLKPATMDTKPDITIPNCAMDIFSSKV